ncbi:EAL domain-containing protein [Nitriliruptoraceae bacterium ZYF776]|nr:EAL domain-containing protein [Profundirhabdus halotolerans]
MTDDERRRITALVAWPAATLLAVLFGRLLLDPELGLALIRPVAGIGTLWVLWARTRRGRAAAVGGLATITLVVEIGSGADPATTGALLAGLVAQATTTAALLRRDLGEPAPRFWTVRDGLAILVACLVGATAAAAVSSLLLVGVDAMPSLEVGGVVLLRNLVGVVLVICWWFGVQAGEVEATDDAGSSTRRPTQAPDGGATDDEVARLGAMRTTAPPRPRDVALPLLASVAVTLAALLSPYGLGLAFAVLPLTVWTSWRLGARHAAFHLAAVALTTTAFAVWHRGPLLPGADLFASAFVAQIFLAVVGTVAAGSAMLQQERDQALLAEQRSRSELARLALYDGLTGLPNRTLLYDRLAQTLAGNHRSGLHCAVLFLDLDGFKHINDELGHAAGDELLRHVAARLRTEVRPEDTVARMSGDEFIVLCPGLDEDAHAAERIGERIVRALEAPFHLGVPPDTGAAHTHAREPIERGTPVHVSASVGFAVSTASDDLDALLARADAAMYAAKARGRNRLERFDDQLRDAATRRVELRAELDAALHEHQFTLHFQPLVSLRTGRVVGAEALVRWRHPHRGLLPPGEWLDVIEDTDAIIRLGRWVLDAACRTAHDHLVDARGRPLTLHVNIASRHLLEGTLVDDVRDCLARHDWPAEQLVLEITEPRLDEVHPARLQRLRLDLHTLATDGVRIALDDFGSAGNSLDQLVELPVQLVKIDRVFVRAIATEPRAHSVVRGILSMAGALDLQTVAEGVETDAQAAVLRELGCLEAQGFLWSAAAPADLLPLAAPT